jgi:hypothetical protein
LNPTNHITKKIKNLCIGFNLFFKIQCKIKNHANKLTSLYDYCNKQESLAPSRINSFTVSVFPLFLASCFGVLLHMFFAFIFAPSQTNSVTVFVSIFCCPVECSIVIYVCCLHICTKSTQFSHRICVSI